METFPNVFQPASDGILGKEYELKGKWGDQVFRNSNPIILEVGCGKGEYTVGLACLYPDKNFIGIDIKGARMWKGAKYAVENKISNAIFVRTYAEMLESLFAQGEVAEIWITFPDPQMSKVRKRLTGTRFLSIYKKILCPSGTIHLKTDSPFLYRYTCELLKANHLQEIVNTDNLYECGLGDPPLSLKIVSIKTFYEQQWLSRGKQIKYIHFSLQGADTLYEPDVEIEKDDYKSTHH